MKRLYKLLFTLLLLPLFSFAQSNYKPGYLVTLKGDTLRGFIDFQEWDSNPTAISFKSAFNDRNHQSFSVNDISYFNVNDLAAYKKYTCAISMDETNTAHLVSGRDTSYKIETVFLKILQKGNNVELYSYTDGLKTRFYISEAPGYIPTELVYRIYEDSGVAEHKEGNTAIENTFLKQLFALANKYNVLDDNLTDFLQKANYVQPDLLTIVSRINKVSKSEYEKKYAGRGKFNLIAGLALNITNTSSPAASAYSSDGGGPSASYLPAISFGFNFVPNPDAGRVVFRSELSLAAAKFNSLYQLKVEPYTGVKFTYNQLTTSLIPQIIYNVYNSADFKFYLGFGFLLSYANFSNVVFEGQNTDATVTAISQNNPFYFDKVDISFILKAGFQFNKKWEIVANYLPSASTTNAGYFDLTRSGEQIGVVYIIGK